MYIHTHKNMYIYQTNRKDDTEDSFGATTNGKCIPIISCSSELLAAGQLKSSTKILSLPFQFLLNPTSSSSAKLKSKLR